MKLPRGQIMPRGLRLRVVATFALGGLTLSLVLAALTSGLADRYLVAQRERSATRQTYVNARAVRDDLAPPAVDASRALAELEVSQTSSAVLHTSGAWFSSSVRAGRDSIPRPLRQLVASGSAGHQRVERDGDVLLVVGVPLPAVGAEYFEIFFLVELESTLGVIRNALLGAAATTTVVAALLGVWAGRRVLRPLAQVGDTAREIAAGNLERRLDPKSDVDLEQLAVSFNRMVDALQHRIERDARFASNVSHELRSPLTSLATASELLERERGELPTRVRTPLAFLITEVRQFQRLVEDLLELAQVDAAVPGDADEPVRLGELVLHAAASNRAQPFTVELDPDLADTPILTDKRRLERVLANLLGNAATHGGGVVRVAVVSRGEIARIEVEDEGPGIPAADRERVFERFYRGAAAGRRGAHPGSGLGLALVAEHVRLLNGRVWIDDRYPTGTRFVVELPRRLA